MILTCKCCVLIIIIFFLRFVRAHVLVLGLERLPPRVKRIGYEKLIEGVKGLGGLTVLAHLTAGKFRLGARAVRAGNHMRFAKDRNKNTTILRVRKTFSKNLYTHL